MTTINLPFPDPRLSPNKRLDRRSLIEVKQAARENGFYAIKLEGVKLEKKPLSLTVVFFPPDSRRRDLDNLYSSFKAYQDGIFEALDIDDSLIKRVTLQWGTIHKDDGSVNVILETLEGTE